MIGVYVGLWAMALGTPAGGATGWPGAFETDAPLISMVEVRFAKGAQIANDGNVQLDDAIARVGKAGYWLVEGASDSGGASACKKRAPAPKPCASISSSATWRPIAS